ncbi:hypothetical protein ACH35V_33145 [Actinomadura sp. 1N219]|uniref:hypothetical protein n=1 Tax=Actinomadura sp. 1N219 TaxID=3375152 RepID=UPI003789502B
MGDQKSEIDTEEVRKIIKALKAEREKFEEAPGTTLEVQQKGNITVQDLGTYHAGHALAASTGAAFRQISSQYEAFLDSYDGVIQALERMIGNHDEKEQTNIAAANAVSPNGGANLNRNNSSKWGGG